MTILLGIVIYMIVDWPACVKYFEDLTAYIREHPYEAIIIIIIIQILLIIFILPVSFLHILVAIAYCKVYHSYWIGFLMATWVLFVGTMIGALIVIYLSRYLIADWVKKQIKRSKS